MSFNQPIHFAVIHNNIDELNRLISEGVNVNALNGNNDSPLYLAMNDFNFEIVIILLSVTSIDVNIDFQNCGYPTFFIRLQRF